MRSMRTTLIAFALAFSAFLLGAAASRSAGKPGELDRDFAGNGVRVTRFDGPGAAATDVAIDSHGRAVAVGSKRVYQFAIARYTRHGNLDRSFDGNGRKTLRFGSDDSSASAVAIDDRDRPVIAGGIDGGRSGAFGSTDRFAVARLDARGRPDRSFSGDGQQTVDFRSGGKERAIAVLIDGKGRITMAGYSFERDGDPALVSSRLKPDGSLDRSYGDHGKAIAAVPGLAQVQDATFDRQGRIVAAASVTTGPDSDDITAIRVDRHGRLDDSFGDDGIVIVPSVYYSYANAIAVSGSRVLVGGFRYDIDRNESVFGIARLKGNGDLDDHFGEEGVVETAIGTDSALQDLIVDDKRRIVAVGRAHVKGNSDDFAVARYRPGGRLDNSFSGNGRTTTDVGAHRSDAANAVALMPNGRILAAGDTGPGEPSFALIRYLGR